MAVFKVKKYYQIVTYQKVIKYCNCVVLSRPPTLLFLAPCETANVLKNRRILKEADLIDDTELGYEFLDPAFELWLKREYRI